MQHMFSVLALFGMATFAVAEGSDLAGITINQISTAQQTSENLISRSGSSILNGDRSSIDFDRYPTLNISNGTGWGVESSAINQSILNAANILMATNSVVNTAEQTMLGDQIARNRISANGAGNVLITNQIGENLANIIDADRVERIVQAFGPGATQLVLNDLTSAAAGLSGVMQTGRNTANVVTARLSIGSGEQLFPSDTVQRIENTVDLTQPVGPKFKIDQSGTNIGNVLVADDVRNVTRVFSGDQIVRNTVVSNGGYIPARVNQTGLNIANFVSAQSVDGLTQVSDGNQIVENNIEGMSLAELSGGLADYSYSSTNIVNLLEIRGPASSSGSDSGSTVRATQTAEQSQRVQSKSGTHSQVGNSASIIR
jgi:hypothetical protein